MTVFSSAVPGLEERAFAATQECRLFLAERLCFRHEHRGLSGSDWGLRTWGGLTCQESLRRKSGGRGEELGHSGPMFVCFVF